MSFVEDALLIKPNQNLKPYSSNWKVPENMLHIDIQLCPFGRFDLAISYLVQILQAFIKFLQNNFMSCPVLDDAVLFIDHLSASATFSTLG